MQAVSSADSGLQVKSGGVSKVIDGKGSRVARGGHAVIE
jgi:hypothetical protein